MKNVRKYVGLMLVVAVVATACFLSLTGCAGINANAAYSTLIDQKTADADEVAKRAAAGQISAAEFSAFTQRSATGWHMIQDAKNGVATPPSAPATQPAAN